MYGSYRNFFFLYFFFYDVLFCINYFWLLDNNLFFRSFNYINGFFCNLL